MKYKIESFDEKLGQIVVEFDDGIRTAIDLPLTDLHKYPEGEELKNLINSYYPVWHIERMKLLANGISNAEYIRNSVLVKEETIVDDIPAVKQDLPLTLNESEEMQMNAFREIVLEILKEKGL